MDFRDITPGEFEGLNESKFEAAVVDAIIKRHGDRASDMRKKLQRRVRSQGPDAWPKFYDFFDEFAGDFPLPMYLFVRRFQKIQQQVPVHVLVEGFEKTKPYAEWLSLADEIPDAWRGPVGLVFFWPYLRCGKTTQGGALVLHNGEEVSSVDSDVPGFCARYRLADGGTLFLESFARLLDGWQRRSLFG